jgi:hypothetical protein
MTLDPSEASRLYQAALEYRRTAGERYSTDEELAECDEAVEAEHRKLVFAVAAKAASA